MCLETAYNKNQNSLLFIPPYPGT